MRIPSNTKAKQLSQGDRESEWWSQNINPHSWLWSPPLTNRLQLLLIPSFHVTFFTKVTTGQITVFIITCKNYFLNWVIFIDRLLELVTLSKWNPRPPIYHEVLRVPADPEVFISIYFSIQVPLGAGAIASYKLHEYGIETNMRAGHLQLCFTLGFFKPCILVLLDDSDMLLKISKIHLPEMLLFPMSTYMHLVGPSCPLGAFLC